MSKPTYLFVTPFFPSCDDWRGAYCLDFVKALCKARPKMRVKVFVASKGEDYEIDGIKVWRFKEKILKGFVLPFLFRRRNERSFLATVERAGVDLNDVVVCHGNTARFAIYPLTVKRINPQIKTLLHHHDLASFGLNLGVFHKCSLYNVFLFRQLCRLHEAIDCHVFISEASRRSFLSAPDAGWTVYDDYKAQMRGPKLFGCMPVKIKDSIVLHNGVDVGLFKRLAVSSSPLAVSRGKEEFIIGCVGNFGRLKDQMTLLRAIKLLQPSVGCPVSVVFIGSGEMMAECKRFAAENGIDAEFRKEVRHQDLPKFYHELDLFVLPSYFEGFGCVYTEAWSCGVPFIACEGQGIADFISPEDRGKWLCNHQDANDLADKISAYMKNRWQQNLTGPVGTDMLVGNFCKEIGI